MSEAEKEREFSDEELILRYRDGEEEIIGLILCRRHFVIFPPGSLKKDSLSKRHPASFCEPSIWHSP